MGTEIENPDGNSQNPGHGRGATGLEDALTPGLCVDDLELQSVLGVGTTSTVFRASLRANRYGLPAGAEVAAKFLHHGLVADRTARQQMWEEGQLGRTVRDAQVVDIFDVGTADVAGTEWTYLVMELIRGHSLRAVVTQSGSVVEELARQIGFYAARGLHAIHRLGLVHRDIKPENIALTDAGTVKLMDLGLARSISREPGSAGSGFYGSLSYAAPEVLLSQPATPSSDLYSLGVVLFEMVTGRHPFADPDTEPDDVIHRHLYCEPPRPSHFKPRISAFLEQVLLSLLAKNPADRIPSAATLAATFDRGESSRFWLRHEQLAPRLASLRRLRAMRRAADTPFLGRRRELRELDRRLRRAGDGRGQAVFLSGPRGMGRRRMLDHWIDAALDRRSDIAFLGGECRPDDSTRRAAPFTGIVLEWFLRGDEPDSPQAQSRLASRIALTTRFDPTEAEQVAAIVCRSDEQSTPEARADLLARLILAMPKADQTLIVRIDLAERMSTTTEMVVHRLIEGLAARRVLFILVSLDGRLPPPGAKHIPLAGLDADTFGELGRRAFADGAAPVDLLHDAHATLAGSPGNLLDALASLQAQGKIAGPIGAYRMTAIVDQLPPPDTLLERLRRRLDALTEPERFVHVAAAVLGNTFPIRDLSDLVGQTEISVLETLSIFQDRIIVTNHRTGRFRHRDFRKVMLESVPTAVRRQLHRNAAWALEDRGAPPLEVGLHLSRAGEHAAAIGPLLLGLERLVATGSRKSSLRICNRLRVHLAALDEGYDRDRLRFFTLSSQAEAAAERGGRARQALTAMRELATRLADDPALTDAHIGWARLDLGAGRMGVVLEHLTQAEALLLATVDDPVRLAKVRHIRARVHGYRGQGDAARIDIREALRLAADTPGELLPHLHTDLARIQALQNDYTAALQNLDTAEAIFGRHASAIGLLRVQLHRGHILSMIGSRDEAQKLLEAARARGRELSNRRVEAKAELFLGEQAMWYGEDALADSHFEATIRCAGDDPSTRVAARIHLAARGRAFPDLGAEVDQLDLVDLRIAWLLVEADRTGEPRHLDEAVQLERESMVPLPLHRELLYRTGQAARAHRLERRIAEQLPRGPMRRRFLRFMRDT